MKRDLEILPLTPERLPDLGALFNEGGDPKWCWCAFFRVRGITFQNASARRNRAVLERAVDQLNDRAPGLVAYRQGAAIGWVSLGPREDYERLTHSRVLAPIDDRPAWSIVCFVVGRKFRGEGVAASLLEAAIRYASDHGATLLEGYPVETDGARISSANAYKGTLGMFERAGFNVVGRRRANRSSPDRPIVRRQI